MKFRLVKVADVPFSDRIQTVTRPTGYGSPAETRDQHAPIHEPPIVMNLVEWARDDPKQWSKVLKKLKQSWNPSWLGDSPRDVLVAWASINERLHQAREKLDRLKLRSRLTSSERRTKGGLQADYSFLKRSALTFQTKAGIALQHDHGAATIFMKLCDSKETKR